MPDYDGNGHNEASDVAKAKELYAAGKPVFTRALLEYFNEILETGQKYTKFLDYLDRKSESDNELPSSWRSKGCVTFPWMWEL